MEYRLKLVRDVFTPLSTLGVLYADDVFICFTCEDKDRRLEDGGIKIAKQSAIPRGKYKVIIDLSTRFNRQMPHVLDVPGFSGIRIHRGNTAEDTEGCILVGVSRGETAIYKSAAAFTELYALINKAQGEGKQITLEVV